MKVKIDHMEFDPNEDLVNEKAEAYVSDDTTLETAKEWAIEDVLSECPFETEVEIDGSMADYEDEEALKEAIKEKLWDTYDSLCYDFEIVDIKE